MIRCANATLDKTRDIALWSFIEPGLGLVCIGLAALRPLLRAICNKIDISTVEHSSPGVSPSPQPLISRYRAPADAGVKPRGMGYPSHIEASPPAAGAVSNKPGKAPSAASTTSDDDDRAVTKTMELTTWFADDGQTGAELDLEAQQLHQKHVVGYRCSTCGWSYRMISG